MTRNETIEKYCRENRDQLVKYARKRVGDYSLPLAEDAVQEAFYRACKYYRAYDPSQPFGSWFSGILNNAIRYVRSLDRGGAIVPHSSLATNTQFDNSLEFTKEAVDLLQKENPRNNQILNMYFFYGFDSRQISDFMVISSDVVRDVIRTFRKKLRNV